MSCWNPLRYVGKYVYDGIRYVGGYGRVGLLYFCSIQTFSFGSIFKLHIQVLYQERYSDMSLWYCLFTLWCLDPSPRCFIM